MLKIERFARFRITKLSFSVAFSLLIEILVISQRFPSKGRFTQGASLSEHYLASTVL